MEGVVVPPMMAHTGSYERGTFFSLGKWKGRVSLVEGYERVGKSIMISVFKNAQKA